MAEHQARNRWSNWKAESPRALGEIGDPQRLLEMFLRVTQRGGKLARLPGGDAGGPDVARQADEPEDGAGRA